MLVLALEKQSYNFPFQATISFGGARKRAHAIGPGHCAGDIVQMSEFRPPQGSLSCCGNEWWSESRLISILIVFTLRACRQTTAYQLLHTAFTSSETGFFIV